MKNPKKGAIQTMPLKGFRKGLPTALLFRATPEGVLFYALVSLLPVSDLLPIAFYVFLYLFLIPLPA